MTARLKVVHIIAGLGTGGAEMMLYRLLAHLDTSTFACEVISLGDMGTIGERIVALGIPVHTLHMSPGIPDPRPLLRLVRLLRATTPHLIQTWMYHADLLGGVAAQMAGRVPVIWGIHNSTLNPTESKYTTIAIAHTCAHLSGWLPSRMVVVSHAAREIHRVWGYRTDRMLVIPNGFDVETFAPDITARLALRRELCISNDHIVLGLVARFAPQKDHKTFFQAAAQLHACMPDVQFVLCGKDITWENRTLVQWIDTAGVRACCHLLGPRDDMPRLYASMDIATMSSSGEALPLAIGEAMACGVPCVVTDVGDSAFLVGASGRVVPPRNPYALARAWATMGAIGHAGRVWLGQRARQRIIEHYNLASIVNQYEALYRRTIAAYHA